MTTETTDAARNYPCKYCGATDLTKGEQLRHGKAQKTYGLCAKPEAPAYDPEPITDRQLMGIDPIPPPTVDLDREAQIKDYARNLTNRPFIHRSINQVSTHGAEMIARRVIAYQMTLNAAALEVIGGGFSGWKEGAE